MDASARVECLPSTREDILQFIIDWAVDPSSDRNILWVHGVAGSGKSAISTSIANYFRELGRLGAFLFFDHDVPERNDPHSVIRTLAYQLAQFDTQMMKQISSAAWNISWQWPLSFQMNHLILKPVSSIDNIEDQGPVVLVFDALDECGSIKTRKALLNLLVGEFSKFPRNFRLIVTSRAERDIQATFGSQPNVLSRELDLTTASNTRDIELYLRHWMSIIRSNNPQLPLAKDWPGESTILDLAARSFGLFVWASTAMAFIDDGYDPRDRLSIVLRSDNKAKGEAVLDELYITTLKAIGKWKDDTFCSDFSTIMGTILVSIEPVSPITIDNLIKPARPSLHTISHLGCVIHWSSAQPLRILHPSFADFLTDRERCAVAKWYIDLPSHHWRLARQCLKYLNEKLHENILGQKLDCNRRLYGYTIPECLAYAATYWIEHLCLAMDDDVAVLVEEVDQFLKQHLLHWFEAMSTVDRIVKTVHLLEMLQEWIKVSSSSLNELCR